MFGFGKERSPKVRAEAESIDVMGESDQALPADGEVKAPPTIEEMEAHAKKYAEEHGPAVFKGSEDLNKDPGSIEWQNPDTIPDVNSSEVPWLQGRREDTMFNRENREQK